MRALLFLAISLVILAPAVAASPATLVDSVICRSPSFQCEQYQGNYGTGAFQPCTGQRPTGNAIASATWTTVHDANAASGGAACTGIAAYVATYGASYGAGEIQPCAASAPSSNAIAALLWSVAHTSGACGTLP